MSTTALETSQDKIRILVAEDDFAITLALKTIIKNNFNCELTITHNGEEAWQAVQKSRYDLVISDWNMPIKTGCELLENIRSYNAASSVPFIMLTARADKDSVVDALKLGVTDYLHKPFDRAALISKISDVITQHSQTEETSSAADPKKRQIIDEIVEKLKADSFELPVLSDIAETVANMVAEQNSSIPEIAEIIKNDPVITARLVALANSPIYRGSKNSATLEEAITRVGIKETTNYLWFFSNAALFETDDENFSDILTRLREHSMATAECARLVARHLGLKNADEYFYLGLMHDIGAVLILEILKEISKQQPIPDKKAIGNAIFQLHTQFGGVLLKRWKMSTTLQNIALHHEDLNSAPSQSQELLIVNFANQFAHNLGYQPQHHIKTDINILDLESTKQLSLDNEFIDNLELRIHSYMDALEKMMQPQERISLF